jgi:hypothetical protein
VELVLPGHNQTPLEPDILVEMAEGFAQIVSGAATGHLVDSAWGPLRQYDFMQFSVLLPLDA